MADLRYVCQVGKLVFARIPIRCAQGFSEQLVKDVSREAETLRAARRSGFGGRCLVAITARMACAGFTVFREIFADAVFARLDRFQLLLDRFRVKCLRDICRADPQCASRHTSQQRRGNQQKA